MLPNDYFEGKDIEHGYERVLFLPRVLQSQELNGMQSILKHKIRTLFLTLFKDREVLSGTWSFDGKVFKTNDLVLILDGYPYKIDDTKIEVPSDVKYIASDFKKIVIGPKENLDLLDPVEGENFHEPGALRLKGIGSLKTSHESRDAVFKIEGKNILKAQTGNFSANTYDYVIDLDSSDDKNFNFNETVSRVFIKSTSHKLKSPIKIAGNNVHIHFSHDSILIIEEISIPYFFEIQGSVKVNGCRLALKGKAVQEKQKIKIASVPKGSRLFMHDYTVSDLAPRSYEGEGVFQHNVVWEEAL